MPRPFSRRSAPPALAGGGLLLVLAGPWAAPLAATPSSTVASETSVTLVEIPVEVEARNGDPLTDLGVDDFVVSEGVRSLPIVAFERIELGRRGTASASPPSPAARRHLFFLFDFAFSDPRRILDGVAGARRLLADGLDPSDLVAVAVHLPRGQLAVLATFTADRAAADRSLAALTAAIEGSGSAGETPADPLRLGGNGTVGLLTQLAQSESRNIFSETLDEYAALDGKGGALMLDYLLSGMREIAPDVRRVSDSHAANLLAGMTDLASALRGVDGRKMLVLFSQGFAMPRRGGTGLLSRLELAVEELRHSGWALHAVDLTGTRGEALGSAAFAFLAGSTGGGVVENTQDFAGGLADLLDRSAHAYLLTVQVDDLALDGAFHPLSVRLVDPLRRARMRHRDGYFAPLPFAARSAASRSFEASRWIAGDEERDELGIEVAAVRLGGDGDPGRVLAVVEVPGNRLFSGSSSGVPGVRSVEVFAYALDPAGVTLGSFAYAAEVDPEKVGARLASGGLRVLGELSLPSGDCRLRILVRDLQDGRSSLRTVPLSVPGLDRVEASAWLEALFLPATDDPWIVVPATSPGVDLRGRSFVPAAQAALPARGEAQLFLIGSGLTEAGTSLRGKIVATDGRADGGGGVDVLGVSPGTAGEPDVVVARLRAGELAPGRYLLELKTGGGASATTTVRPFVILP